MIMNAERAIRDVYLPDIKTCFLISRDDLEFKVCVAFKSGGYDEFMFYDRREANGFFSMIKSYKDLDDRISGIKPW